MKVMVQTDDATKYFDNVTRVKSLLAFDMFKNKIEIYHGKEKTVFKQHEVIGFEIEGGRPEMLTLPIKKKWFDLMLSGEKKEEYRSLTPYYKTRFMNLWGDTISPKLVKRRIIFRNGYSKDSPYFVAECTCTIGTGKEEWGAEKDKQYFILTIHKILKGENRH